MRLIQICVDAIDDVASFAQAINNWPALIASGVLTTGMLIATFMLAPWVYVVAAILAIVAASVWVCILLKVALPVVRRRVVGFYLLALASSSAGLFFAFWPSVLPAKEGLTLLAAVTSLICAFLAHEMTRELSLRAGSLSVYKNR